MNESTLDPIIQKFNLLESKPKLKKSFMSNYVLKTPQKKEIGNLLQKPSSYSHNLNRKSTLTTSRHELYSASQFHCEPQFPEAAAGKNKLEIMMDEIRKRKYMRCNEPSHQNNKLKFICLERNCQNRIGCSYCLLKYHKGHQKVEVDECLKDLERINEMMLNSYDEVIAKKTVLRAQILEQLDKQISNLCDQFHRNLQFLKNKAISEINEYLFQKYKIYEFMETLNKPSTPKKNEDDLIHEILDVDILGIEKSIENSLIGMGESKNHLKILIKYFEQMNGSVGFVMAQFKKSFPKIDLYQLPFEKTPTSQTQRKKQVREDPPAYMTHAFTFTDIPPQDKT